MRMKVRRLPLFLQMLLLLCYLVVYFIPVVSAQDEYAVYFISYDSGSWSDPSLVDMVDGLNSTRDTHNRKVAWIYERTDPSQRCWQVFYWMESDNGLYHAASFDGSSWTSIERLYNTVSPYYGANMDVDYINQTRFSHTDNAGGQLTMVAHTISSGGTPLYFLPYGVYTDGRISKLSYRSTSSSKSIGGSGILALNNETYFVYNRDFAGYGICVSRKGFSAGVDAKDTSLGVTPDWNTTTGGCQLLRFNSSAPYSLLSLAKNSTHHLCWSIFNLTTAAGAWVYPHGLASQTIAQLESGLSTYSATSEVDDYGDPERCHLTYLDSTGALVYRSFNGTWGSSEELYSGSANCSYPVINVDESGNLLLVYVRNEQIRYFTKPFGGSWSSESSLTTSLPDESTYSNPAYLSSNHYAQDGRIGIVWTAEYNAAPTVVTPPSWTSVAAPYAYAAINLMSISLTVGVGVGLLSMLETQEIGVLIPLILTGVGIMIALFIALPILSAFMGM